MAGSRILLDTSYLVALLNKSDKWHAKAVEARQEVEGADRVFVTEAVLVEVGNFMRNKARHHAVELIEACYKTPNMDVVEVDSALLGRGVQLYRDRPDKGWSLTDCISLVVMDDESLTIAATRDHHFEQAGHQVLLK